MNYEKETNKMKNINAIGRVTKDAQVVVNKDIPVCNFNVAVNTRKATAEKDAAGKRIYKQTTDYIRVSLWRDHAKALAPYLTKGRLISIQGDFELETWIPQSGENKGKVLPTMHMTSPAIELLDGNAKEAPAEPATDAVPDELPFDD